MSVAVLGERLAALERLQARVRAAWAQHRQLEGLACSVRAMDLAALVQIVDEFMLEAGARQAAFESTLADLEATCPRVNEAALRVEARIRELGEPDLAAAFSQMRGAEILARTQLRLAWVEERRQPES